MRLKDAKLCGQPTFRVELQDHVVGIPGTRCAALVVARLAITSLPQGGTKVLPQGGTQVLLQEAFSASFAG